MAVPVPPDRPFDPFEPSESEPWDFRRVNHLLRRAAIGAGHDQVHPMLALTPAAAVDSLLDFDATQDPFNDMLDQLKGFFNFQRIEDVQGWFFFRMLGSKRRAQERMTLFWHNHFATSASKVENPRYMHLQMELFRQKGLGSFRDLLLAVSRDPAMLVWLDGQSNKKGHANENWGREVMELFTLGIGNYTEKDVQELARCFTGWKIAGEKANLDQRNFDNGPKTLFNTPGNYDSAAAVEMILKQPAAPKYLSRKILREFVHPDAPDDFVDHYAQRLIFHDWQIKPVMKEIFTSRMFFSQWAYHSRIKSPVELVVGAAIALGGKANTDFLSQQTTRMGQRILFPPNVKGWDGNEEWINANTVLVRFNFGLALATQQGNVYADQPDLESELKAHNVTTADQCVNYLSSLFLDGWISGDDKDRLVDFLENPPVPPGQTTPDFVLNHNTYTKGVREVMHMMMAMPVYQLA